MFQKRLIENFESDLELRQLRPHTIESYMSNINYFVEEVKNPIDVERDDLRRFLKRLQTKNLADSTIKTYFIAINNFYDYLKYEEIIESNPIPPFRKRYLPRRIHKHKRMDISKDQAKSIIRRCSHVQDKTMNLFFAKLGLRKGELLELRDTDIDLNKEIINAPITGKRLESRPLFFDDELLNQLLLHLDWRDEYAESDYLFISQSTGSKMHKDHPNYCLRKIGRSMGLYEDNAPLEQRMTPHVWRRFATTAWHRSGMNEQYIKYLRGDVLGRATWEIYLEIDPELVREQFIYSAPRLL